MSDTDRWIEASTMKIETDVLYEAPNINLVSNSNIFPMTKSEGNSV